MLGKGHLETNSRGWRFGLVSSRFEIFEGGSAAPVIRNSNPPSCSSEWPSGLPTTMDLFVVLVFYQRI
jgi:hypothetical protein